MITSPLPSNVSVAAASAIGRPMPLWVRVAAHLIQHQPRGRYRTANWLGRRSVDPFWGRLPHDLGRLFFQCDLRDHIMREVCFAGCYEPQETALLKLLLRPGMTVVDVGANWGYFSLAAAHLVGSRGRVVSVEADPRACRTLRANVARNGLDAVVNVLEMAASDRRSALHLREYAPGASASGNYGLTSTTTVVDGGRQFEVPARQLDEALDESGIDRVDVLKMDIEGAEALALRGLERRLSDGRIGAIVLEVHPQHLLDQGSSVDDVVGRLRFHGYHLWTIDHSPSASRRIGAGKMDVRGALAPLTDTTNLGSWPHVLCTLDPRFLQADPC
ncbi:MAG: FkbM family methyltransferase [Acidobacteriota bacterium]